MLIRPTWLPTLCCLLTLVLAAVQMLAAHCPKRLRHVTVAGAGNGLVTRQVRHLVACYSLDIGTMLGTCKSRELLAPLIDEPAYIRQSDGAMFATCPGSGRAAGGAASGG